MTFAHPWLLVGTLAALVPLLVHLFNRPSAPARAIRGNRIRAPQREAHRVASAPQTGAALCAADALSSVDTARPRATRLCPTRERTDGPRCRGDGNRHRPIPGPALEGQRASAEDAKVQAKSALGELLPEESASVVACARGPTLVAPLSFDRTRQLELIDELKPGWELGDLNRCLEAAARSLDESALAGRRIVVVSPFTQQALSLHGAPPVARRSPRRTSQAGGGASRPADPRHAPRQSRRRRRARRPAPQVGLNSWQFTFTVRNFSDAPAKDLPLQLKVDGVAVAKGFVESACAGLRAEKPGWKFAAEHR